MLPIYQPYLPKECLKYAHDALDSTWISSQGVYIDKAKDKLKEQLAFGATMVQLSERPFFTKNNLGEEPIRNKMYGLDVSYRKDLPRLTKLLDKLPFYSTTAPSSINL